MSSRDVSPIRPSTLETSSSMSSLNELPITVPPVGSRGTPFVIGVAGGGSSGKKTVCKMIMERLLEKDQSVARKVVIIRMEDFYHELHPDELKLAEAGEYNFDHPHAVDFRLLEQCLQYILDGRPVDIPQYDFQNHIRLPQTIHIDRPDVVIFSGIYMLYKRRVRDALNLKVFVDVDSDVRLARQVERDTEDRYHKPLESVLQYYVKYVKPSFEDFIAPSKKFADVIIPRGHENTVAIDLLTQHIIDILHERAVEGREVADASVDVRTATTAAATFVTVTDKFGSVPQ